MDLLRVEGVSKSFGGLHALKNVDVNVDRGEILGVIGPNGSGKTTLFNVLTGFYKPDSGKIKFLGENIEGLKPHKICKKGMVRTFQVVKPFGGLKVFDNVLIGAFANTADGKTAAQEAIEALKLTGLLEKKDALAKELTLASRKRLELARALAAKPVLLLLDEMAGGLNPTEIAETMTLLRSIHEEKGITLIIIEHVMKVIMSLSNRIVVLNHGEKIAEGTPQETASNPEVVRAYLGEEVVA